MSVVPGLSAVKYHQWIHSVWKKSAIHPSPDSRQFAAICTK